MNFKKLIENAQRQGLNPQLHENHKMPLTRREMVAQSFIAGSSFVMTPSLVSMMSQVAYGDNCGAAGGTADNKIPVVILDGAGGFNIAGSNVMVGKTGGQMDFLDAQGYGRLGIPAAKLTNGPEVDTMFGLAFHKESAFLEGMKAGSSPEAAAKVNGMIMCATSADDTSMNPHSPVYWIAKYAGRAQVTGIVGTDATPNGGRSIADPKSVDAANSSTVVRNATQARDLVSATLLAQILPDQVPRVMKAAQDMSATQLEKLAEQDLNAQAKLLINCNYKQVTEAAGSNLADRVDFSRMAGIQDVLNLVTSYTNPRQFNLNGYNNINDGRVQETLSGPYLALTKFARCASVEFGGRDYHANPRSTTDARDFEMGLAAGRIIEMAHRLGTEVCLYIYTDGAVACADPSLTENTPQGGNKPMWASDAGQCSSTFSLVYSPKGRPKMTDVGNQIGAFRDSSGGVDTNQAKIISNSVVNLARCFFLNYLALHGDEGKLKEVVGDDPFGGDIAKYIAYSKIL